MDFLTALLVDREAEVVNENGENINQMKSMLLARVRKRAPSWGEGRIHQFNSNKEGDRWHWAGRTGKDQRVEQRINPSDINKDVYERLGTHYNEVRKK